MLEGFQVEYYLHFRPTLSQWDRSVFHGSDLNVVEVIRVTIVVKVVKVIQVIKIIQIIEVGWQPGKNCFQ